MMRNTVSALSLFLSVASCQYNAAPVVHVKNGSYYGVRSAEYNQEYFLGMPYAQPPVGNLRFRNPVSLNQSWAEPRAATKYSGECYGYGSDQWNYEVSEDCLYINVIRPAGYEKEKLPVAFWIHGGGFFEGGGVDQRYNISFMVQNSVKIGQPVIGVNINYRLSTWGFLSGSEEVKDQGTLNVGLRDQRLALHWVQENIEAFGGDREKVTIFGESAGAASVGFHLTAYNGRDDKLFRGAIMQSGNPIAYGPLISPLANAPMYNELTRRTGCADKASPLECLRQLPAAQLNTAINTTNTAINVSGFGPILDGDFIARPTSLQLAEGDFVHVPIIDGANSDEGTAFSPSPVNTTEDFRRFLSNSSRGQLPEDFVEKILKAYPDDPRVNVVQNLGLARPGFPFGAQFRRSASYFGDQVFIAPRRKTCETWAAAGVPAYCYRFNAIPAGLIPPIGVTHFQEVSFVFYNIEGIGYPPVATPPFQGKPESYRTLSKYMNSNWVSFMHSLDPNAFRKTSTWAGNEQLWPKYDNANPMDYVFDANVTSYAEPDTYRAEGMKLINDNALNIFMR